MLTPILRQRRPGSGQRGFSIIEIMTSIVILAILLVIAMPQYFSYLQNQQIRSMSEGIAAGLQFARAEAVTRNTLSGVAFNMAGADWTVTVVETGEVLRAQRGSERMANTVVAPAAATIVFNALGRSSNLAAGSTTQFDVTNPTGGACVPSGEMRCLSVRVSASGGIRACDPSKPPAATDPMGC